MAAEGCTSSSPGSAPGARRLSEAYKLDEGEDTFGVRVPVSVLEAYRRLPKGQRKFVRDVVKAVLAELVRSAGSIQATAVASVQNYNININVPAVLVRAEDSNDVEILRERVRELEFKVSQLQKLAASYRERLERAAREKQAAEARAAQLAERVRNLESRLKDWWATKGRVESTLRAWARGELASEEALRRISEAPEFYVPELIARRQPPKS